jgi:DedD protein
VERPVKERLVGAAVLMAAAVILIPEMLSGPDRGATEKSPEAGEGAIKTYTIDLSQSPGVTGAATSPQATDNRAPPPDETPSTSAPSAEQRAPEPQAQPEPTPPAPTEFSIEGSPPPSADAPGIAAESTPPPAETSPRQEPSAETRRAESRAETPPRQIAAQPARAEAPPQNPPQPRSEQPPVRAEAKPQAKPEAQPKPVASAPSAPTSSVPAAKGWAVQLGSYSSEATAERLMNEWRAKGQNAFVMPVKSGGKTLYRVRIGPTKDRAAAEAALKSVKASIPGAAVVAHP